MEKRLAVCLIFVFFIGATLKAQESFKGNASYYADRFHGRKMSNGQLYHRDSMTCAHLKFPFGTMLKVRNPKNGKEVVVKVTDRGPFTKKFVIDLSRAAARKLGIIAAGFSMVEITKLPNKGIPYRMEDEDLQIPELDLNYSPAATYPEPAWDRDSLLVD